MTWYAIQHKPAQGQRALLNLQNQLVPCFYPKIEVERIRGGKRQKKLEPLFPGYIFINLEKTDPVWSKLRSTLGVLRIVSFAGKPAAIDDATIQHLKSSLERVSESGGIKKGEKVQLEEGPFRGIDAIFEAYDGEQRAIILINFMQQNQRVSVPLSVLKS